MKCFCTPKQPCPMHGHQEYSSEEADRDSDRAEALREITEARDKENWADEQREDFKIYGKVL